MIVQKKIDDYMFYLSQLLKIIEDFFSPYVYICGDFNANVLSHSRFIEELRVCFLIIYYVYLTRYFYHLILLLL